MNRSVIMNSENIKEAGICDYGRRRLNRLWYHREITKTDLYHLEVEIHIKEGYENWKLYDHFALGNIQEMLESILT